MLTGQTEPGTATGGCGFHAFLSFLIHCSKEWRKFGEALCDLFNGDVHLFELSLVHEAVGTRLRELEINQAQDEFSALELVIIASSNIFCGRETAPNFDVSEGTARELNERWIQT